MKDYSRLTPHPVWNVWYNYPSQGGGWGLCRYSEGLVCFFCFPGQTLNHVIFLSQSSIERQPLSVSCQCAFLHTNVFCNDTTVHDDAFLDKKIYLSLPQLNAKKEYYISLLLFELQFFEIRLYFFTYIAERFNRGDCIVVHRFWGCRVINF